MYITSEWLVDTRQLASLCQLSQTTESLDGEFLIVPDIYFHQDKPFIDTILVTISKFGCGELMQQVDALGFSSWQEQETVDRELAFNPFELSAFEQRTWGARLQMAHQHNRGLQMPTGSARTKQGVYDKPI